MARTPNIDLREDYQRNYIINGNFDFWQRDVGPTASDYLADRFNMTSGNITATTQQERSSDAPENSNYSWLYTVTSSNSTAANAFQTLEYIIEGHDLLPIKDRSFTVSFKVKSSVTGVYPVSFRNIAFDRSYVSTYTINQPNVWEEKSITLTHDSTGTWNYAGDRGLIIDFGITGGTDFETSTVDQWQSGDFFRTPACVNVSEINSATFQISQIQLVEGAEELPFRRAGKDIEQELALCLRYFQKTQSIDVPVGTASTTGRRVIGCFQSGAGVIGETTIELKQQMRAAPTVVLYDSGGTTPNVLGYTTISNSSSAHAAFSIVRATTGAFNIETTGVVGGARGDAAELLFHYTADAEL